MNYVDELRYKIRDDVMFHVPSRKYVTLTLWNHLMITDCMGRNANRL